MKYLTFIRHAESTRDLAIPPALNEAMGAFITKAMEAGTLVDTGGLAPTKDGVLLRVQNRKLTTTDGPFTEAKEVIGGFAILQGTREEVLKTATEFVELHRVHWPDFEFECEVRAIEQ